MIICVIYRNDWLGFFWPPFLLWGTTLPSCGIYPTLHPSKDGRLSATGTRSPDGLKVQPQRRPAGRCHPREIPRVLLSLHEPCAVPAAREWKACERRAEKTMTRCRGSDSPVTCFSGHSGNKQQASCCQWLVTAALPCRPTDTRDFRPGMPHKSKKDKVAMM